MHTRVRATRALGQYFFSGQPSNSRGEFALHRRAAGLHLPAGEFGAVIRKDHFKIAHDLFRVLCRLNIIVLICQHLVCNVLAPASRRLPRSVSYTISLTANLISSQREDYKELSPEVLRISKWVAKLRTRDLHESNGSSLIAEE